jgi:hypothetical protein
LLKKVFQFFCILDYEISYSVFSLPGYVITLVFTHKLTGHILSVWGGGGGGGVAALHGAEIVGRILSVTKYACIYVHLITFIFANIVFFIRVHMFYMHVKF